MKKIIMYALFVIVFLLGFYGIRFIPNELQTIKETAVFLFGNICGIITMMIMMIPAKNEKANK